MKSAGKIILVLLLFLLFPSLAAADDSRIIGGSPAPRAGATVALVDKKLDSYRGYFCAGSLIRPRWVLTARHCFFNYSAKDFDVVVGRKDLQKRVGQRIAAARVYFPSLDKHPYTDIALVYLAKKSFGTLRELGGSDPSVGEEVEIEGWGAKRNRYPHLLQKGTINILAGSRCVDAYSYTFSAANLFCAGKEDIVDSCWGDSGGPLLFRGKLVAVVSFGGRDCALSQYPSAYAKIDKNWVSYRLANPPKEWIDWLPGKDTKKVPPPYILSKFLSNGNTDTGIYNLELIVASNFKIIRASARLRGPDDMRFCNEVCVGKEEWFSLRRRSGLQHAGEFFDTGNYRCPTIDTFVEIKHRKRRFWKDSTNICNPQRKIHLIGSTKQVTFDTINP